jgi:hypothetical protein
MNRKIDVTNIETLLRMTQLGPERQSV